MVGQEADKEEVKTGLQKFISFSPRRRFVFQTEISGKYIVLVLISLLFYFFSSLRRGDQSTVSRNMPCEDHLQEGEGGGGLVKSVPLGS